MTRVTSANKTNAQKTVSSPQKESVQTSVSETVDKDEMSMTQKKNNFMRNIKTAMPSHRESNENDTERRQERLPISHMHALSCFKPKEIFNINSDFNFVQRKVKDPAYSDTDSEDDEQEITDLLKGDEKFPLPKENPGIVRLDVKRFDENKPMQ